MIGKTISHYKITDKLGEGGMGVVYKALDTRLDRDVALKFLPAHLSASEDDKARFIQEAKAAATLDHANICTIYSIEEHEHQLFIAMQLVEGQLLRDKMSGMTPKQAIETGIQIAEGLSAAHERGVVHRDIKPENIMIRKDGVAQIMDFGLAKLKGVSRLTKEGSTVGTAGYMSPEQVQGEDADHRSDIFSLGVLLYEMLTGQLPFKGVHETAVAYEIVNVDAAPMAAVKPEIDPSLDGIILECLEKDPNERTQSAKQVAIDLKRFKRESSRQRSSRITAARPAIAPPDRPGQTESPRSSSRMLAWRTVSAILFVLLLIVSVMNWLWPGSQKRDLVRFSIGVPVAEELTSPDGTPFLALAHDGASMIYKTVDRSSTARSYLRRLDEFEAVRMPALDWVSDIAFSPGGQWVAFVRNGILMKLPLTGGAETELSPIGEASRGLWWANDGYIYCGRIANGIMRVREDGGEPEAVTTLDSLAGEISHRNPCLLPGNEALLYSVKLDDITTFDDADIDVWNLGTGQRRTLLTGGMYARYAPTGHIVYSRGGSIFAVPFDTEGLQVQGPSKKIVDGGGANLFAGNASWGFSSNGTFVYGAGGPIDQEVFLFDYLDISGKLSPLLETPGSYFGCALSPDGEKLALDISSANDDIWIYHIRRNAITRLTFGGGNHHSPVWTRDGKNVIYSAVRNGLQSMVMRPWDGSGDEEILASSPGVKSPSSASPDGQSLLYLEKGDLWTLSLGEKREPEVFLQSPFTEWGGVISPDGRWVAYLSDESGVDEVYMTTFPERRGKWQVSSGGAWIVFWSNRGNELFYQIENRVMRVAVETAPTVVVSAPRLLLEIPRSEEILDMTPDDRRFVVRRLNPDRQRVKAINVVLGWFEELKAEIK